MTIKSVLTFFSLLILFCQPLFSKSNLSGSPYSRTFDDVSYDLSTDFNAKNSNEFTALCTLVDFGSGSEPIALTSAAQSLTSAKNTFPDQLAKPQKKAASQSIQSTTIHFAAQNINTSSPAQTFTIRGNNLNGTVTVMTNAPFAISKDSVTYETSTTYSVEELSTDKTIYVKFNPKIAGNYTGNITSVSLAAESKIVNLSGTAVDPSTMISANHLIANNILTPNGDGRNDIWIIKNIEYYPDNTVRIFDKSGRIIYTKKGYTNDWNGTYNNTPLSEGTYYYVVELGTGLGIFKGFITIIKD